MESYNTITITNKTTSYNSIDNYNNLISTKLVRYESTPNYGLCTENSIPLDDRDVFQELLITYRLHKIRCWIETNTGIVGIQLTYKDRETNEEIVSIDVHKSGDYTVQEFTLDPLEFIIQSKLWKKDAVIGFEVTTNKKRSQRFGYDNGEMIIPEGLDSIQNLVMGFYFTYEYNKGITSMGYYYLNRKNFSLVLYSGLLYLRIILKDKNFKENIKKKLDTLTFEEKALYLTCTLPDNTFFGIVKYTLG